MKRGEGMNGAACAAIHSAMTMTAITSGRLVRSSGNAGCNPSPRAPSASSAAMPVESPFNVTSVIDGSRVSVAACVHSIANDSAVPVPSVNSRRRNAPQRRGASETTSAPNGR